MTIDRKEKRMDNQYGRNEGRRQVFERKKENDFVYLAGPCARF
jgi:hypothetical protein